MRVSCPRSRLQLPHLLAKSSSFSCLKSYNFYSDRNWKWRSTKNVNKPYKMKLHRNTLDPRFCVVTWLLLYLSVSGIKSGALFQTVNGKNMKPAQWTKMTERLFVQVVIGRSIHFSVVGLTVTLFRIAPQTTFFSGRVVQALKKRSSGFKAIWLHKPCHSEISTHLGRPLQSEGDRLEEHRPLEIMGRSGPLLRAGTDGVRGVY